MGFPDPTKQPVAATNGLTGTTTIDETTPLITSENGGVASQSDADYIVKQTQDQENTNGGAQNKDDDRPLDKRQMLVLCYARMVEPIAFFSIFPFVNQMIHDTGSVKEEEVGFYSGLIESLFSATQMLLLISWGYAADRIGRRPVLIISLIGIAVGMSAFGFSANVWQMILFRCFAGVFAGSTVTIRAMFSENSTPQTQARAFSLFAVSGNLGIFIGPLVGGALAEPAKQYPRVFGGVRLFEQYPYCLASLVTGAFSLSAVLVCFFYLNETLDDKERRSEAKPMTTWELLKAPGVSIVLFIYSWNMMLALAFTAVLPVFWFTSPPLGGFGFSPVQMSAFMALGGVCQALWTLFLFPPWQKRVGTGSVLKVLYYLYPLAMAGNPLIAYSLRTHHETLFWILLVVGQVFGSSMAMTFTGVQLALNDIAPSHVVLGMLNAVALTFLSAIRAVAPAMFASLFAFGVKEHILGGYFVWLLLTIIACVLPISLRWLPAKAYGGPLIKPSSSGED
ncbi:MFS transporter [Myriangium duriaei CBS 260.36]|uniref:MFS transporter n=1 Tax=Myriangium duriaei CBS 260.36 TaxID=1168546 RepID=A0A9P4JAT1_9PEZI|nr:MFS transporter [Myriangium duriaei CBS 260.36]